MFGLLDIAASGLAAQRTRLDDSTANLVNQSTILDSKGRYAPFRRRITMLAAGDPVSGSDQGVHVSEIKLDKAPFHQKYEPDSPYANGDGMVDYPNIDSAVEMINAM